MRNIILAITLSTFLCMPSVTLAGPVAYAESTITKLGRGIENIGYSPVEIPVNMYKQARKAEANGDNNSSITVGYFTGLIVGIGFMVARIGVGVAEIVSFPVPTGPLMQPPTPDGMIETLDKDDERV
jgi:putative exosortase-associated protein (TIGR04073 family)